MQGAEESDGRVVVSVSNLPSTVISYNRCGDAHAGYLLIALYPPSRDEISVVVSLRFIVISHSLWAFLP